MNMAISRTNVNDLHELADWLSAYAVPAYFASVEYSSNCITCKDADGHTRMTYSPDQFAIYKRTGVSELFTLNGFQYPSVSYPAVAASCGGGLMVIVARVSPAAYLDIIITRTDSGETAVIVGSSSQSRDSALRSGIHAVSWGDAYDTLKTLTFSASAQNQTQLVPFTTYAEYSRISYTPNAFYMPVGEYYSLTYGKFNAGDDTYITNGYWAIKD
jgi:hypothetical protein